MTTIVVTATEILHDTQATIGNVRQLWDDEEKATVVDGKIYCGAGDFDAVEAVPAWLKSGGKVEDAPGGEWSVIVISRERGKIRARFYDETQKRGSWVPLPTAIGSGGDFALTVLKYQQMKGLPQDAYDAVSVACAMDVNSGGVIKRLKIDDMLAPPKPRVRKTKQPKQTAAPEIAANAQGQ